MVSNELLELQISTIIQLLKLQNDRINMLIEVTGKQEKMIALLVKDVAILDDLHESQ